MIKKMVFLLILLTASFAANARERLTINNNTPDKLYSDGFMTFNCHLFNSFKQEVLSPRTDKILFYANPNCSGAAVGTVDLKRKTTFSKAYEFLLYGTYLRITQVS